jgi:hypothetical protein
MANTVIDPRYRKGKIYAIKCMNNDDVYIGSTTQELHERLYNHIKDYYAYIEGKTNYVTSFELIDTGNYFIELIKNYPCNNKSELEKEEGRLQREMDCINRVIAGRSSSEYYRENIVEMTMKKSQKFKCECGSTYRRDNKSHHIKTKKHQDFLASLSSASSSSSFQSSGLK